MVLKDFKKTLSFDRVGSFRIYNLGTDTVGRINLLRQHATGNDAQYFFFWRFIVCWGESVRGEIAINRNRKQQWRWLLDTRSQFWPAPGLCLSNQILRVSCIDKCPFWHLTIRQSQPSCNRPIDRLLAPAIDYTQRDGWTQPFCNKIESMSWPENRKLQ